MRPPVNWKFWEQRSDEPPRLTAVLAGSTFSALDPVGFHPSIVATLREQAAHNMGRALRRAQPTRTPTP